MRPISNFLAIAIFHMVITLAFFSCSSTEKSAVSCPEFPNNKYHGATHLHKKKQHRIISAHRSIGKHGHRPWCLGIRNINPAEKLSQISIRTNDVSEDLNPYSSLNRAEYLKSLTASLDNATIPDIKMTNSFSSNENTNPGRGVMAGILLQPTMCDTIILRRGDDILGKVIEIGQDEIKYRKCDNLNGPSYAIRKSEVFVIKYVNGTSEFFTPGNQHVSPVPPPAKKTEGLGLTAFICGVVGLIIAGIPLGIMALVFGAIGLSKVNRYPDIYMGRGFAITGIVLGIIDIVGVLLILSSM